MRIWTWKLTETQTCPLQCDSEVNTCRMCRSQRTSAHNSHEFTGQRLRESFEKTQRLSSFHTHPVSFTFEPLNWTISWFSPLFKAQCELQMSFFFCSTAVSLSAVGQGMTCGGDQRFSPDFRVQRLVRRAKAALWTSCRHCFLIWDAYGILKGFCSVQQGEIRWKCAILTVWHTCLKSSHKLNQLAKYSSIEKCIYFHR